MTLASDGKSLTGLWFEGQKYFCAGIKPGDGCEAVLPVFDIAKNWLDEYFSGKAPDFLPPVAPVSATPFRMAVWQELLKIPYGSLVTYGEIAKSVAKTMGLARMSAQAVGGAVGHNPISLIIPCHRVVGSDGSLTGYAGGVWRKKALIELERRNV